MRFLLLLGALNGALMAQLPEGPGMAETARTCKGCHEVERSVSLRQDKDAWNITITKMVGFGMKAAEADLAIIADYLAKYYPADALPPLNVNKATAIELESRLGMRRSQAAAFLAHREKVGKFKTFAELKQAPGIDPDKLDAKKTQIVF
ncbi:MAG: ComEA family DNA-binding protein [Bryobacteraceae bacterium]